MASHNDFEDMIRESHAAQLAKAQQLRRVAEEQRSQALEARQRTLEAARYAARLLVEHHVSPTVRLQRAMPETYTWGLFGRRANPTTYEKVAEGWPVAQSQHESGFAAGETQYDTQGVVLTTHGELTQYTGGSGTSLGSTVHEPVGDVTVTSYGPLRADLSSDTVMARAYQGTYGVKFGVHEYSGPANYDTRPAAEQQLQRSMADLVARFIPTQE